METDIKSDEGASTQPDAKAAAADQAGTSKRKRSDAPREEQGGPGGPEPTRYGDWERKGIAKDF